MDSSHPSTSSARRYSTEADHKRKKLDHYASTWREQQPPYPSNNIYRRRRYSGECSPASSYGSVASGISHPPRAQAGSTTGGNKRKRIVDADYTAILQQASPSPSPSSHRPTHLADLFQATAARTDEEEKVDAVGAWLHSQLPVAEKPQPPPPPPAFSKVYKGARGEAAAAAAGASGHFPSAGSGPRPKMPSIAGKLGEVCASLMGMMEAAERFRERRMEKERSLKAELEGLRKVIARREATISALEAAITLREDEIARLRAKVKYVVTKIPD